MRLSSFLRHALPAAMATALWVVIPTSPAAAQFKAEYRDRTVSTDAPTNLFFDWKGSAPLSGFEIAMPRDWVLEGVDVVRRGFARVPGHLEPLAHAPSHYQFHLQHQLQDEVGIVLRVKAPPYATVEDVAVAPLVGGDGAGRIATVDPVYRAHRRIRVERKPRSNANRTLILDDSRRAPILLRASRIPDLGTEASFSVEYWLKTLSLDRVVLSTWDGDEQSPYPVEMVVSAHGRLMFYRGRPGEHNAMSTTLPVADGTWHHVALVHDAATGWTRLYLDGAAQDSLFAPHAPRITMPEALAIGGRAGVVHESDADPFVGEIDELRFWTGTRSANGIRHGMRRSLSSEGDQNVFLSFERTIPSELLARPVRLRRERSDLSFAHPVQELRAGADGENVSLTWETDDPRTLRFLIERSIDGREFVEVGRIEATEALDEPGASGTRRFRFIEPETDAQVVYYRIRQQLRDGSERVTASAKIGLGTPDDAEAVLVGNYPNPFNASTTIAYRLERSMQVRLSVWDVAGQPVAELVNAEQDAGFHEIAFEATDLPSGTYFVRMQTPRRVGWRTLTLMK